jgi:ornithine cyclodeaminase/alanine dehydrogenase-like protein (mu-crystallin family)
MLFLTNTDIAALGVAMRDVVEMVAAALAEKAKGDVELPPKLGLAPRPGAVLHAMPARVGSAFGMKWIASFPKNRARGVPPTTGVIVLNDSETGAPSAVLDADWITTMRTGAVAAVAARMLARPDAQAAAIIGPGRIGTAALAALRLTLRPGTVRAWAPRFETAQRFARANEAEAVRNAEDAIRDADVIITAAPWPGGPPRIEPDWIAPGAFACALDYDASFTREAIARFDVRVADDVPQMDMARAKGSFAEWPRFSELCTARRKLPDQRIVCAALGLALFDVAVASRVVRLARERGIGRVIG